jgi:hypothetical protein
VWEVPALKPVARPSKVDAAALWRSLQDGDAKRSWKSMAVLLSAPADAVALLKKELKPRKPVDPKHIAKLVADLDSDSFDDREKAEEELSYIVVEAEAALRKATKSPSVEQRKAAERLLKRISGGSLAPERMRTLRAFEILEKANTPGSRALLKQLSKQKFDALLANELRKTLVRMGETVDKTKK